MKKIIIALYLCIALPLLAALPTYAAVYPSLIIVDHVEPAPVTSLVVGDDANGNIWDFPDYNISQAWLDGKRRIK